MTWISVNDSLPPQKTVVKTIIFQKEKGRMEQNLMLIGRKWFLPGSTVYINYSPTHWKQKYD